MSTYHSVDLQFENFCRPSAPYNVQRATSGSSGTLQVTNINQYGLVHEITSTVPILWIRGTGASVSAASGHPLGAYVIREFIPLAGNESIGWQTVDGAVLPAGAVVSVRPVGFLR